MELLSSQPQHKWLLNLQNSFEAEHAFFLFLSVDTFLRFAMNSFEEWQATTCHFSRDFHANLGNVLTMRKKIIKIQ